MLHERNFMDTQKN